MVPRNAFLNILYNNKDISQYIRPYIAGWSYTDNLSGQADDLQITLEDKDQLWSGAWMPEKGSTIAGVIYCQNWGYKIDNKTTTLNLGRFDIDEIEPQGPPSTVTIKGTSIPQSSSLRGEKKNRAWEKTKLSVVANDIASKAKLKLFYDTQDNPEYDRIEQTEESDLEFLMRLCNDAGLCLKVSNTQVIIFDESKYESQVPITTIKKGDADIISYGGKTSLTGVYRSCRVEYHDTDTKKTIKATFTPPNTPKTDRVLVINERVKSIKEAQILAKKRLRQENKDGTTFSITLMGDIRFLAGLTVNLVGWGKFDGKYIITQAGHNQQDGYKTTLQLRKCLEGY